MLANPYDRTVTGVNAYAAETGKYVSEIRVSYASSYSEAVKELGEGYTVIKNNFNKGLSGNVFIGYKTTDVESEAITGVSVMNMNGGFNYDDYKALLEEKEQEILDYLQTFKPVIIEYVRNYDKKAESAIMAYKLLNVFYEDESGMGMGDYLLKVGKSLISTTDESNLYALSGVVLRSNSEYFANIRNILTLCADVQATSGNTWLTRLSQDGPDALKERIAKKYELLGYSTVEEAMSSIYDANAKKVLEELPDLRQIIKDYESSKMADAETDSEIEAVLADTTNAKAAADIAIQQSEITDEAVKGNVYDSFEAIDVANNAANLIGKTISEALKELPYGDGNLYDFFMDEELTAEALYPAVDQMSVGMLSQLEEVGIVSAFQNGVRMEDPQDKLDEFVKMFEGSNRISIYDGVDQSLYTGDVAITSSAIKNVDTSGDTLQNIFSYIGSKDCLVLSAYIFAGASALFLGTTVLINTLLKESNWCKLTTPPGSDNVNGVKLLCNKIDYARYNHYYRAYVAMKVIRVIAGIVAIVAGAVMLINAIIQIFNKYYRTDSVKLTDIPLHMVDKVETDEGVNYIYYNLALTAQGQKADLHNAVSGEKQWLALYTTKDPSVGKPIAANIFVSNNSSITDKNADYEAVKLFGGSAPLNFNESQYTGNSKLAETYIYISRNPEATATASIFGNGYMWAIAGGILLLAAGAIIFTSRRNNKMRQA